MKTANTHDGATRWIFVEKTRLLMTVKRRKHFELRAVTCHTCLRKHARASAAAQLPTGTLGSSLCDSCGSHVIMFCVMGTFVFGSCRCTRLNVLDAMWVHCGIVVELLLHGVVVVGVVCERCVHA